MNPKRQKNTPDYAGSPTDSLSLDGSESLPSNSNGYVGSCMSIPRVPVIREDQTSNGIPDSLLPNPELQERTSGISFSE